MNAKKKSQRKASFKSAFAKPDIQKTREEAETTGGSKPLVAEFEEGWMIKQWWRNLFIVKQKINTSGEIAFEVSLDAELGARFSALSKGITNRQTALMHGALWKLHLLALQEREFGDFMHKFRNCVTGEGGKTLSQIAPVFHEALDDIVQITELFIAALFPELRSLVYQRDESRVKSDTKTLEEAFCDALEGFNRSATNPSRKSNNRLYFYSGREVSLSWLAIRFAWNFVESKHELPTKLDLRLLIEKNAPEQKISDRTWSDALETAGLSKLPEAEKYSHPRNGKKGSGKK